MMKQLPVLPMARAPKAQPPLEMSPYKFAKKIEEVLETYVRPQLAKDDGDIEIIDIKDTKVYCTMRGACATCVGSQNTIKMLVEQALKDRVDQRIQVIEV
jgi:NifU-like protein